MFLSIKLLHKHAQTIHCVMTAWPITYTFTHARLYICMIVSVWHQSNRPHKNYAIETHIVKTLSPHCHGCYGLNLSMFLFLKLHAIYMRDSQCTVHKSGNHRYTNSCSLYSAENLSVWGNDVAFNQCPWSDDCMKTRMNVTKAGIMLHHMYGHGISIEAVNIWFWFKLGQ